MMTRRVTRENSQNYEIKAYFTDMPKLNNLTYSEYLHIAYDIKEMNSTEDKVKDLGINLSDILPESRSLPMSLDYPLTSKKSGEIPLDLS